MGLCAQKAMARTGAVTELVAADGSAVYQIDQRQRDIHVTFEALAVFVAAPALTYIAYKNRSTLPVWQQAMLYSVAGASLAVDGWLLYQYLKNRNGNP
jgi:hypothetical protein